VNEGACMQLQKCQLIVTDHLADLSTQTESMYASVILQASSEDLSMSDKKAAHIGKMHPSEGQDL
jgi:vesicle coat complex subunit